MAGLSMCERYTTFWICQNMPWQSSEYILGSKYVRILNIAGFWICLVQYIAWGHSASSWALIEKWAYSEPYQRSKIKLFAKMIIAFNYFCRTLNLKSLRGFYIYWGVKYVRVLNTPGLSICQGSEFPELHRV